MHPREAPARVAKGLARHPIPVMVLARLAVDVRHQDHGVGRSLLKDAVLRSAEASQHVGARAILVHARDARVQGFYRRLGFEPSPVDPMTLMLLMKDARQGLA